jgi:membrane protease YdiL (CAAX protease family)
LFEPDADYQAGRFSLLGAFPWLGLMATALTLALIARKRGATIRPGLAAAGAAIAGAATTYPVIRGLQLTAGPSVGTYWLAALAGEVAIAAVAVIGLVKSPGDLPAWSGFWRGALYTYGGMLRLGFLLYPFARSASWPVPVPSDTLGAPGALPLLLAVAAVAAPIAEELLFRGALLPWLALWLRPAAAVGITSTLFAAMHYHYGIWVLGPLLIGLVLSWVRLRTGRLLPCIALHMSVNLLATLRLLGKH